ncbi:hypothetical protein IV500_04530 [Paeniglutamicibacter antarcticus]|uniref:Uncharacterized protein n=1 Tax=Arthrobacter terrae TaxID=2935737 RepID=A0A931G9H0_9MICC|nr:hypothetical protein [Arthrobacter terrae]MBG0738687.1 hypothetical protein [Arthrobacter terrae]
MAPTRTPQITIDQLRKREIVTVDLLDSAAPNAGDRRDIITAPVQPLSVFSRKVTGHDS